MRRIVLVLAGLAMLAGGAADVDAAPRKHKRKTSAKPVEVMAPADAVSRNATADEKMSRRDKDLEVKNICTNC